MPRACSICSSSHRADIEAAIVEGVPARRIAARWGVNRGGVAVHRDEHLPELLADGYRAKEAERADTLLDRMDSLERYVVGILVAAADGTHEPVAGPFAPVQIPSTEGGVVLPNLALHAAREFRHTLELRARLEGQLDDPDAPVEVRVTFDDGWRTGQ